MNNHILVFYDRKGKERFFCAVKDGHETIKLRQNDLEQHSKARSKQPECWSRRAGWPAKARQSRRETGV
jgi:hypothetical protein